MSNDGNTDLNAILGDLEDELGRVKAAREQVDEVVLAGTMLSESCDQLVVSLTNLIQGSSAQFQEAANAFAEESRLVAEHSEAIEKMTAESAEAVESIRRQGSEAQKALERAARSIVDESSSTISGFATQAIAGVSDGIDKSKSDMNLALEALREVASDVRESRESLLKEGSEALAALRQQASDAKDALQQSSGTAVDKALSEISGYTSKAVESFDEGVAKAREGIDIAVDSLTAAESDASEERGALLQAHREAADETKRQSEETRALLREAQERLADIDERILTLKEFDLEGLTKRMEELEKAERENTASLRMLIMVAIALLGTSIIISLIALMR